MEIKEAIEFLKYVQKTYPAWGKFSGVAELAIPLLERQLTEPMPEECDNNEVVEEPEDDGVIETKVDCFAYIPSTKRKNEDCSALMGLYCKDEKCSFYKPKSNI